MAIKGSDIKNKLPDGGKKNCKECGFPTCFAFSMKVAKGDAEIGSCPHIDPGAKAEIEDALMPPMVLVTIGTGSDAIELGGEEVMYRHEKSFLHQPAIAILVTDKETADEVDQKIDLVHNSVFERAQVFVKPDMWAIRYESGDPQKFAALVGKVKSASQLPVMIICEDANVMLTAWKPYADLNPMLYPVTENNLDRVVDGTKEAKVALGLKAGTVGALISMVQRLKSAGKNQFVLDPSSNSFIKAIEDQTVIRRCALQESMRDLGYPTLGFPCDMANDKLTESLMAGMFVAKYAGVIVFSTAEPEFLYPLLLQRMDIYADPRKLRSVEAKIYEVNSPGSDAPVLVTTNFALTFFNVSSEIETSRVPAYLAIVDTGGFGVETAMGAGKFDGSIIANYIKASGLDEKIGKKRIILPHIAQRLKHELTDDLPDWEVYVGPKVINQLTPFLVNKATEWGLKPIG